MAFVGLKSEDRFEAVVDAALVRLGITLTIETDFNALKELLADLRPDHPIGDPFRPDLHNITPENSCYIVGRNERGDVMYIHALRVLNTGRKTVAEYFRRNFLSFSPPELQIDVERSRYRACPDAHRMRGRIVYSGEVWVGGAPGEYRGTGLISFLMRHAMLAAMQRFEADYFLGFVTQTNAMRGVTVRFGYMHLDPLSLLWYVPGDPKPLKGAMVYMSGEDMRYIMDLPEAELEALAA